MIYRYGVTSFSIGIINMMLIKRNTYKKNKLNTIKKL